MSAIFLVAGTCIGGGMLALPVATGANGFLPSIVMMLICWFAMTVTALLLIEVSLWMEEGAHIITMTSKFLGKPGKALSWVLYLFICYASIVAYTAGGGSQIASALDSFGGWSISKAVGCIIFILIFGFIVDLGTRIVGRINAILFIAMILTYVVIIGMGVSEVKTELLFYRKWSGSMMAIPLLLTSFSFQTMVPSLTPYLKRNPKALRLAVIGGTTTSLVVYIIWQWLVLGIIPVQGPNGLINAAQHGELATKFLRDAVQSNWIATFAEFFAFFALVTSFLGIALGLFDFLADGLNIKKQGWGKLTLGTLIAVPTLFFAIFFERAFLVGLDASGGFGDSILNGLIPISMVWIGRYRHQLVGSFRVPGGKPLLIVVFLFFLFTLILETLVHMGHLSSVYDIREINEV